ncbi:MAG: RsmB/NOP family class I SAM-dependent RNA methyltransferase [Pseudomonadota bacterium]
MTPAARVQAAIDVIDRILENVPAEKALTSWARRARYAGSKDRAAVRDYVYQALRCRDSYAAQGGKMTGRAIMLGQIRAEGHDPATLFSGATYAPAQLTEAEQRVNGANTHAMPPDAPSDLPQWLMEEFVASLGDKRAQQAADTLRKRAPITLRVNARKTTRDALIAALAKDGIVTEIVAGVESALHLREAARRFGQSNAYHTGEAELQDAHSQAAMACLKSLKDSQILDYCAGGGGKTLALAAQHNARFFAYDSDPCRMNDLPKRARRAGIEVEILSAETIKRNGPFDLVLCDAPCSGSGTWRRHPEAKWALTPERLKALCQMQSDILRRAAELIRPDGRIAYTTCSILNQENEYQIEAFLAEHPHWTLDETKRWPINDTGDGFFLSVLTCSN